MLYNDAMAWKAITLVAGGRKSGICFFRYIENYLWQKFKINKFQQLWQEPQTDKMSSNETGPH